MSKSAQELNPLYPTTHFCKCWKSKFGSVCQVSVSSEEDDVAVEGTLIKS